MDFARRFRAQVHNQVGASQREAPHPGAGGGNLKSVMIAQGGFKGGNDGDAAGQHTALAFQLGYERIGLPDLRRRCDATDHYAVNSGPHSGAQVRQQQFRVNLNKQFRSAAFDVANGVGYGVARRGFVRLGYELYQIQYDDIGGRVGSGGNALRLGHWRQQPGTAYFMESGHRSCWILYLRRQLPRAMLYNAAQPGAPAHQIACVAHIIN